MTASDRLSTFALDVDTASYAISRRHLLGGYLPPASAVRMEEFVNAFDYAYPTTSSATFSVHAQAGPSPFRAHLTLLKIGVKGKVLGRDQRKAAHLVFVVDTSGSMERPDRLPLVQAGIKALLPTLGPRDKVSLVAYGSGARLVLEAQAATEAKAIVQAVEGLQCQGSTNLLDGLELGYRVARQHFVPGAVNRVVLASDGVANVGASEVEPVLAAVTGFRQHGIGCTTIGLGVGAYNDRMMESLANRGDGSYLYLDDLDSARRAFVESLSAEVQGIAKDAKIQVEFDPGRVRRYRLIGYENRDIADQDFRNDAVVAGMIGSGQSSTALYELELAESPSDLGTVRIRYHDLEDGAVHELAYRLGQDLVQRTPIAERPRFYLAAAAGEFAEKLRGSPHVTTDLDRLERLLGDVVTALPLDTQAQELLRLVIQSRGLPRAP